MLPVSDFGWPLPRRVLSGVFAWSADIPCSIWSISLRRFESGTSLTPAFSASEIFCRRVVITSLAVTSKSLSGARGIGDGGDGVVNAGGGGGAVNDDGSGGGVGGGDGVGDSDSGGSGVGCWQWGQSTDWPAISVEYSMCPLQRSQAVLRYTVFHMVTRCPMWMTSWPDHLSSATKKAEIRGWVRIAASIAHSGTRLGLWIESAKRQYRREMNPAAKTWI